MSDEPTLTAEDLADLRAMGEEYAGAMASPWNPLCVAQAFRTPAKGELTMTMQTWIDLEAIRSPLAQEQWPETVAQIEAAAEVFGLTCEGVTPEEAADMVSAMLRAVREAFSMALGMKQPDTEAEYTARDDGFGSWLPIYTCMVTELGLSRAEARQTPVKEAYAMLAAYRRNQGWHTAGVPYALRDLEEEAAEKARTEGKV